MPHSQYSSYPKGGVWYLIVNIVVKVLLFGLLQNGSNKYNIEQFINEKNIKTLISYHDNLNEKLSSKAFPKLYQKQAERRYLFHKELVKGLPEDYDPNFQDGDGDPVFT